jgi:hypothetical protein
MSRGTVFPESPIRFAEDITYAMEDDAEQWGKEDAPLIIAVCRLTRLKFESMRKTLLETVQGGVDVATFVSQGEPALRRIDKLLLAFSRAVGDLVGEPGAAAELRELVAELGTLERSLVDFRDLLRKLLLAMTSPRQPVDWGRVAEVQETYLRGETKPYRKP